MGVISASNNTIFRDSSIMFGNVKRFLSSYEAFNLIQEEEFYRYIKEIINQLGNAVYKEDQAIIPIKHSKGPLPLNFSSLYSAYKITPSFNHKPIDREQSNSFALFSDITSELMVESAGCEIECCGKDDKTIEKVTVRNYVREGPLLNYRDPILLKLGSNVKRNLVVDDSICLSSYAPEEISIDDKFIYTNFDNSTIYIKYFGLPIDPETGLPQIPNINSVEKAIEWYIIYQVMLQLWFNNDAPDLQNKMQKAEIEYQKWFAQALYEVKLPTFQSMADKANFNRGNHRVYRQIYN